MSHDYLSLIVLLVAMVLYVTEIFPVAVTAVASCAVMPLLGIISQQDAFAGFSSETVFIVGGMMVVGTALLDTGVAHDIGNFVIRISRGNSVLALCLLTFVGMLLSSVMNNSTATATLIPVFFGIIVATEGAHEKDWMLPLAVATNMGGLLTLLGSTPQLILHSFMQQKNIQPFGFFEYGKVGALLCLMFGVYALTMGRGITRGVKKKSPGHSHYYKNFLVERERHGEEAVEVKLSKKIVVLVILIGSVVLMATTKTLSLSAIATMAATLCVITRCMTIQSLYHKMDWTTIFVLAGTIGFATGLDKSGGGKLIAHTILDMIGNDLSPFAIFSVLCILSAIVTQFMSNTATCAMFLPIGLSFAGFLEVSPLPMLMGICMSASCSFSTPIATPAMTLVLGPGGYKFTDYMKWAVVLNVLVVVAAIFLTPLFWPF